MNLFEFQDYKEFIRSWISAQPKGGHGEYRRLAQALNVSTTMISQVFKSDKHLSMELANETIEYLQLSFEEGDYFLLLVEYARAGSFKLKERLLRQIQKKQELARSIKNLMKNEAELSEKSKSIFYSSWKYSAIRLLVDLENNKTVSEIADGLSLQKNHVQKILEFLIENKLVIKKNNNYMMGPARTHIPSDSPLVFRHHQNWRLRSVEIMTEGRESDLFFTAPMSLSEEVAFTVRQRLPKIIKEITDSVAPSKSETVRCLNIDWFQY